MAPTFRVYFPEDPAGGMALHHGDLILPWTLKEWFPEINPRIFDHFSLKSVVLTKDDGREIRIELQKEV